MGVTNGTTSTPTVSISSISGNGSLGITIGAATSSDDAGNTDAGQGPSTTFTVTNVAILGIAGTGAFGNVGVDFYPITTLTVSNTGTVSATSVQESVAAPLAAPYYFRGGSYPGTGGT